MSNPTTQSSEQKTYTFEDLIEHFKDEPDILYRLIRIKLQGDKVLYEEFMTTSLSSALALYFTWKLTLDGYDFWSKVHSRLVDYEIVKAIYERSGAVQIQGSN